MPYLHNMSQTLSDSRWPHIKVAVDGFVYKLKDLSREQQDAAGYNELIPARKGEKFVTYTTHYEKGGDLIVREIIDSEEVDEVARFDATKALKQKEIVDGANALMESLAAEYGPMERATWDQQYDEAVEYLVDTTVPAPPLLYAIATARGMGVETLAQRIVANRSAWVDLSGAIVGQRLAYQDALDAATTVEEVQAIVVEYDA
jgi:hypothetical protein